MRLSFFLLNEHDDDDDDEFFQVQEACSVGVHCIDSYIE